MFSSIKPWINVPYTIKPFIKRSGSGTKQFGTSIDSLCYPVGGVKLITDETGAEVTSTTQLYVDGSEDVKATDNVVFEGKEWPILRITTYYRNSTPDVKVVYL